MKKRIAGRIVEWVVFAVLTITVIHFVNPLFYPKSTYESSSWPSTSTYNGFYRMKRNTVDVLFIGSSVAANAFSPQQIYNEYGIRSYNLSSEQQSIFLSYYWIKEAYRYQKPKAVVIDLNFLRTQHPEDPLNTMESLTRKCIDPMKWSPVKMEAVQDIARRSADYANDPAHEGYVKTSAMSFYLPNIRFHTRWASGLGSEDFDSHMCNFSELKGWNTLIYYQNPELNPFTPYVYSKSDDFSMVDPLQEEYLRKLGKLCSDNGTKLICVALPGITDPGFDNACRSITSDIGADYYNYSEKSIYKEIDAHLPKECAQGHSNYWGSLKLSAYTGRLLSEKYRIPSVKDNQYEVTRDFYAQVGKNANLQYITDFDEYLDAIKDPTYTVFMSIQDEGTAALTDTDLGKLKALGIQSDLRGKYRYSWYAVITPEGVTAEDMSPDQLISTDGYFGKDRTHFSIASAGLTAGNPVSSTIIGGTEYSHNTRGINIVVYDNYCHAMIDSVSFDTCGDRRPQRSWFIDLQRNNVNGWLWNAFW